MKIAKALEILGDIIRYEYSSSTSPSGTAIKMAQSALIHILKYRTAYPDDIHPPLKGEDT